MEVTVAGKKNNRISEIIIGLLSEAVIPWMISVGLILSLCGIFKMECTVVVLSVAAGAAVAFCLLAERWKFGGAAAVAIMAAALLGAFFVAGNQIINGFLAFYNGMADTLGRNTALLLSQYELISADTAVRDMDVFLGAAAALCACVTYVLLRAGSFFAMVLWIPAALISICFDSNTNIYGKILLTAGVLFCAVYFSYFGKKKIPMENGYRMILFSCLFVCLMAGAGIWALNMVFPFSDHEQNANLVQIKTEVEESVEQIRYGNGKINSLSKGNLSEVHNWEATEDVALKVTMEEPQSLYLRGFVGSTYTSNRWEDLEREVYYENKDLFYWLHEWGIGGNTQLASLRPLLKETELTEAVTSVQVENVNADSEYLYTPYELISLEGNQIQENSGDSYTRSKEFRGTRNYTFKTYGNLVKDFPQMAAESFLYKTENVDSQYVEAESHYNAFVYENYTELSKGLELYFKTELGYAGEKESGHVNYYSAIQKIRTYLESRMTYGNYGEELPEDTDFVRFFLNESKIGNPVHYATAATLMFRYYGIPSRYVEGYVVTPENVQGASPGDTIEIPAGNAHAWTEIYIDGLGWVPVEMTPEYYDMMQQPDFTKGLEADSTVIMQEPEEEEEEPETQEEGDLKNRLVGFLIELGKFILIVLVCFDIFCLLFFLYALIRRWMANGKRKKAFANVDNRAAVCSMVGYMTSIFAEAGDIFSDDMKEEYAKAYRIGEKAAYSPHEISGEERTQVESCKNGLLGALKKEKGWYEKWVLKYIERLY